MTVDRIEPLDRQKSRVFLDGDFAFVLYKEELRTYGIEEGGSLDPIRYEAVCRAVCARAREKALRLLESRARTEQEIRQKLEAAFFPVGAVEETIAFLREYRYLDDGNYARSYVEMYGRKKSRPELIRDLCRRGIDRHLAEAVCRDALPESGSAIADILRKRGCFSAELSPEKREKTVRYLMRRGFSWEEIRRELNQADES